MLELMLEVGSVSEEEVVAAIDGDMKFRHLLGRRCGR